MIDCELTGDKDGRRGIAGAQWLLPPAAAPYVRGPIGPSSLVPSICSSTPRYQSVPVWVNICCCFCFLLLLACCYKQQQASHQQQESIHGYIQCVPRNQVVQGDTFPPLFLAPSFPLTYKPGGKPTCDRGRHLRFLFCFVLLFLTYTITDYDL